MLVFTLFRYVRSFSKNPRSRPGLDSYFEWRHKGPGGTTAPHLRHDIAHYFAKVTIFVLFQYLRFKVTTILLTTNLLFLFTALVK